MQRRLAGGLAAVLLLSMLTACSLGQPEPATDGDRGPGSATNGSAAAPGGAPPSFPTGPDVAEDFPLPIYSDWIVLTIGSVDIGDAKRWSASFQFIGDVQAMTEQYAADLQELGYAVEITEVTDTMLGIELSGIYDDQPVEGLVSIGRSGTMNVITITFGAPI